MQTRLPHLGRTAIALSLLLALGLGAGVAFAAETLKQKLFLPSNFKIEIDGILVSGFTDVSGTEAQTDVVEYKDGEDGITHKRPGQPKYGNITLTREFS